LFSRDSFDDLMTYGGELLLMQLIDLDSVTDAWIVNYEMSPSEIELMKSIYKRKISAPETPIVLTKKEIDMIGPADEKGLNESRTSFQEMNIKWEE